MKARKRFILILAGVTVAVITAAVPVMQLNGEEKQNVEHSDRKCYTEMEVKLLMDLTNSSRQRAVTVLDMACQNAIKPD